MDDKKHTRAFCLIAEGVAVERKIFRAIWCLVLKNPLMLISDGLFHRILTRAIRWSQECGGHEPQLYYRRAKFYLDDEHDYVLEMAPLHFARISVSLMI